MKVNGSSTSRPVATTWLQTLLLAKLQPGEDDQTQKAQAAPIVFIYRQALEWYLKATVLGDGTTSCHVDPILWRFGEHVPYGGLANSFVNSERQLAGENVSHVLELRTLPNSGRSQPKSILCLLASIPPDMRMCGSSRYIWTQFSICSNRLPTN